MGVLYLVFVAVNQEGACSLMAIVLYRRLSRSCFSFHECINSLIFFFLSPFLQVKQDEVFH